MNGSISARLSVMMFLQFFIWGAWYTSDRRVHERHGMGTLTYWPYTVNPIAAIAAPFFVGLVADRYFATEKVLGMLHLLGGARAARHAVSVPATPTLFIVMLLLYNLCYMPTLGLTSSLAFHHIEDQERQFPRIRVFGTHRLDHRGPVHQLRAEPMLRRRRRSRRRGRSTSPASRASVLGVYSLHAAAHAAVRRAGKRVSLPQHRSGSTRCEQLGSRSF